MDEPDIATPEEVLATFTQLLRSEKPSEQLKAAEQLAKYHSLFAPREEDEEKITPEVIEQVEAAVAAIRRKRGDSGDEQRPPGSP